MSRWIRTTRDNLCPMCQKWGWCCINNDGQSVVVKCNRISEGAFKQGEDGSGIYWMHRLAGDWRARKPEPKITPTIPPASPEMKSLAIDMHLSITPKQLALISKTLGLSAISLRRMRIGWSSKNRAMSFPMREPAGGVIGIRLRTLKGDKFSVKGGHSGLFIPTETNETGPLLITEGPTDTAALLDLGFNVLGRPSQTGAKEMIAAYCARFTKPRDVVILKNNDVTGSRALELTNMGVDSLIQQLRWVMQVQGIKILTPPIPYKDSRDWLKAGVTHTVIQSLIDVIPYRIQRRGAA